MAHSRDIPRQAGGQALLRPATSSPCAASFSKQTDPERRRALGVGSIDAGLPTDRRGPHVVDAVSRAMRRAPRRG
jgi:hypothetical protein